MTPIKAEIERIENLLDSGCSCHTRSPCWWCLELDEQEIGILQRDGRKALDVHWMTRLNRLYGLYE